MKETIRINLSQRLFNLDADAYRKLNEYIDGITHYFMKTSPKEATEIIQDIEQRISELFSARLTDKKEVITIVDVEEVIVQMGSTDEFDYEEMDAEDVKEPQENDSTKSNEKRQLYRDNDNKLIGGVCSGMAAYFGLEPNLIRLIFVLLFFAKGLGILVYFILWLVVPAAKTTAEKLKMKGKPVNLETIETSVKEEYSKVKDNLGNLKDHPNYKATKTGLTEIIEVFGKILTVVLKIFLACIGITFAIAGIALLFGVLSIGSVTFLHFPHFQPFTPLQPYMHQYPLIAAAITILILIPIITVLTTAFRYIFNIKRKNGFILAFSWVIWFVALVFIILSLASGERIFTSKQTHVQHTLSDKPIKNVLHITASSDNPITNSTDYFTFFGHKYIKDEQLDRMYIPAHIIFEKSLDNEVKIQLEELNNVPFYHFNHSYDRFQYNWNYTDSTLILDKYFIVRNENIWQLPQLEVTVFLPENQKILLDNNLSQYVEYKNVGFNKNIGQILQMSNTGLKPLN